MRILDLFCGAGGCAVGCNRAGFDVVGVDHVFQPRYPFAFLEADALDFLRGLVAGACVMGWRLDDFDAIHASPPCQAYTAMAAVNAKKSGKPNSSPRLIGETRALLERTCKPWVIENVVGSPLHYAVLLCGSMFGLGVRRHRLFESSHLVVNNLRCRHRGQDHRGVYGDHPQDGRLWVRTKKGGVLQRALSIEDARTRMGIDWMEWKEITQAIPPAYTEYIGLQLAEYLK